MKDNNNVIICFLAAGVTVLLGIYIQLILIKQI